MQEELLKLLWDLTKKYTANQSSSVTYETAQMLLEAIQYCMEEYYKAETEEKAAIVTAARDIPLETIYRKGYEAVLKKAYLAKKVYERILPDFEDYGCRHYRDTIIKGIPVFFMRYDPQFCPQEHILTLDYPVEANLTKLYGVDLIYEYLQCIEKEQKYLKHFSTEQVRSCLRKVHPDYEELFLGNVALEVKERLCKERL